MKLELNCPCCKRRLVAIDKDDMVSMILIHSIERHGINPAEEKIDRLLPN